MKPKALLLPAVALAVGLAGGFGVGWRVGPGPAHRYCKECGEIIALQARPAKLATDSLEIENLKRNLERSEVGRREYQSQVGEPPDLHPECECLCHRYWIGPASRVHDAG